MSETIFYVKRGRKYVPVRAYDSNLIDAIPYNSTVLIQHRSGCTSKRYDIDPAFAPMVAAGLYAEDAISLAILKASELRPSKMPITEEQREAWKKLSAAFGEDCTTLTSPSIREAAEAGVKAMQEQADKLMSNESVRAAYEHFLFLCKLTAEKKDV